MAAANLLRYGTRTGLTAAGLALAIAAVLFVNVVALSFESGTASVYRYVRSTDAGIGNVWITPPTGFQLDSQTGFFTAPDRLPESLADEVLAANQGGGEKVLTGHLPGNHTPPVVVYGCSGCQTVSLSQVAAETLGVQSGDSLTSDLPSVKVDDTNRVLDLGSGGLIEMPLAIAQQVLNAPQQVSWLMLNTEDLTSLRQFLGGKSALITTDPTAADASKAMTAYVLEQKLSRADLVTFDVKLAALYFNQATSSLLGWLSRITLGLGFVLMLSAALLSIEERRREFGIYAAVGVSSDIFYLFFVESLLLFVGSTLLGLVLGAVLLRVLTPALFQWDVLLKSAVLVLCYLPPMVIFGSLVPAQRLLQKSPLELLRSAA